MLIKTMATHEASEKNFFESNLKKNKNIAFPNTFDFGQDHDD
jgi:hypothetical protein